MTKNSILLIDEIVLPEFRVSLHAAELDLSMMAMFSSLDRWQICAMQKTSGSSSIWPGQGMDAKSDGVRKWHTLSEAVVRL